MATVGPGFKAMPLHTEQADLLARMRRSGLRLTQPRKVIAQVLQDADDHLDVDQIIDRVQAIDPTVHRATVYRTLGTLKKLGMVDELDLLHFRGDRHYYEIRTDSEHAHVICLTCGEVVEPEGETIAKFRAGLVRETGYRVNYMRVEVGGACPRCRAEVADTPATNRSAQA